MDARFKNEKADAECRSDGAQVFGTVLDEYCQCTPTNLGRSPLGLSTWVATNPPKRVLDPARCR